MSVQHSAVTAQILSRTTEKRKVSGYTLQKKSPFVIARCQQKEDSTLTQKNLLQRTCNEEKLNKA
jgi:hypothetical protein